MQVSVLNSFRLDAPDKISESRPRIASHVLVNSHDGTHNPTFTSIGARQGEGKPRTMTNDTEANPATKQGSVSLRPAFKNRAAQDPRPDNDLFDVPSSDDDIDDGPNGNKPEAVPRKRRKLTPPNAIVRDSRIKNNQSLQRHVVAPTTTHPIRASPQHKTHKALPRVSKQKTNTSHSLDGISQGGERVTSKSLEEATKDTVDKGLSEKKSAAISKSKRSPMEGRAQKQKMSHNKSTRAIRGRSQSSTSSSSKSPASPVGMEDVPSTIAVEVLRVHTPPQQRKTRVAATTPKQQQLWNRLLQNESQSQSPSNLEVSELRLGDTEGASGPVRLPPKSPKAKLLLSGVERNKRVERIIDLLGSRDRGLSFEEGDSDGSNGITGDNSSQSTMSINATKDTVLAESDVAPVDDQPNLSASQNLLTSSAPPRASQQAMPLKVTYARQRSYLSENFANEDIGLGVPSQHRRASPAPGLAQDAFDLPDESAENQNGTMRSIHELKEAGGNRRLIMDLETNLEDLEQHESSSLSARRLSFLSLASKILDPSNCRLFLDHGLDSKIFNYIGITQDLIENSLLLASLLQVLFHHSSGIFLLSDDRHMTKVVDFLTLYLTEDENLQQKARSEAAKMSKQAYRDYDNLCQLLKKLPLWRSGKPPYLSAQVMALQCLDFIMRQARESGSLVQIMPTSTIDKIVQVSIHQVPHVPSKTSYQSICCELAVSILESSTIKGTSVKWKLEWLEDTHGRIRDLLPTLLATPEDPSTDSLRNLTLRVYLNLTNADATLCEIYATSDVVKALLRHVISHFDRLLSSSGQQGVSSPTDSLLLSLGCLINFADSSRVTREAILNLKDEDKPFLDVLLRLFMTGSQRAREASTEEHGDFVVAYGYLSVLLSYVCIENTARQGIRLRLGDVNGKFEDLLVSAENFLEYHRQIDEALRSSDAREDRTADFITRSQNIINELRATL